MHDVAKTISGVSTQSKVRPRRRGLGIAIALLVAIVIFVFGIKALQIGKMMSSPKMMPSVTVTSATVNEEDWAPRLSAVGSVSAAQGAVVSTELAGIVSEISFENGAEAKKGEDRKSTRLNSSHVRISYAVFCLKKKNKIRNHSTPPKHKTQDRRY